MSSISVSIYQIGVSAKTPPKPIGFTTSSIGNIWETNRDGSQLDGKVNAAVQDLVNSGFEYTDEKLNKNVYYCAETKDELIVKINSAASSTQPVNETISAEGTNGDTTAYLDYGVNVVTTADASNYAIRLPYPPIKGKTVTIINTTSIPIVVYPSITGGSINGVVNGTATIPADGKSYIFTCWENPLPGAWSWTPPAVSQLVSSVLTLSHTNGVATKIYGFTTQASGVPDFLLGVGPAYNIRLSGLASNWFTVLNQPAISTRIKIGTNVKPADVASGSILLGAYIGEKISASSSLKGYQDFYTNTVLSANGTTVVSPDPPYQIMAQNTAGGVNTPAKLGDVDTIYTNTDITYYRAILGTPRIGNQGFAGTQIYGTFIVEVGADVATGDYEFQFFIEHT